MEWFSCELHQLVSSQPFYGSNPFCPPPPPPPPCEGGAKSVATTKMAAKGLYTNLIILSFKFFTSKFKT